MTVLARQDPRAATGFAAAGVALGLLALVKWWLPLLVIGALVVGAIALQRPAALVPVVFGAIYLEGLGGFDGDVLAIPITLSKAAVAAAGLAWLVHAAWHRKALLRWTSLSPGLAALILAMIVSVAAAKDLTLGTPFVLLFGVVTLSFLVHLIATMVAPEDLRWVLRAMAVLLVLLLAATAGRAGPVDVVEGRFAGTLGDPNEWSTSLILATPLLAAALVRDRWIGATPVLGALLALFPIHVLLSLSRAGLITMLLIAPLLVWILRPRKRLLLAGFVAILALVPVFASTEELTERYESLVDVDAREADGSMNTRTGLLRVGLLLLRENWLTGVGVGMFRFEALGANSGATGTHVAHNTYLSVGVEQGLLGLLAMALLGGLLALHVVRTVRAARTDAMRDVALGYAASVVGFGVMALTLDLITFAAAYFALGLGLAIERAAERSPEALAAAELG